MGKKIEDSMTLMGFAWIDDDGDISWALKEDLQDVPPEDRPEGCTPCVIEVTPTADWVENKRREHDFLGDLQDKMNKFTGELEAIEKTMRVKKDG